MLLRCLPFRFAGCHCYDIIFIPLHQLLHGLHSPPMHSPPLVDTMHISFLRRTVAIAVAMLIVCDAQIVEFALVSVCLHTPLVVLLRMHTHMKALHSM